MLFLWPPTTLMHNKRSSRGGVRVKQGSYSSSWRNCALISVTCTQANRVCCVDSLPSNRVETCDVKSMHILHVHQSPFDPGERGQKFKMQVDEIGGSVGGG